jgi:hypothetical protein
MRYACRGSVVVAVLCVLLSLASAVSAGKVKVVYQYNWYGSTGRIEDAYLELVEQFKRDNPNVGPTCPSYEPTPAWAIIRRRKTTSLRRRRLKRASDSSKNSVGR